MDLRCLFEIIPNFDQNKKFNSKKTNLNTIVQ